MILLDTHVVIWLMIAPRRISRAAADAIAASGATGALPCVSAISIYEMLYVQSRSRLELHVPATSILGKMREWFVLRPVSETIAMEAAVLPAPFHGDPLDRLIVATAIVENCTLLTADESILSAGVCKTLW